MLDLTGFVDPHVHTAPDLVPRLLDDVSSVREAFKVGMIGILIKNHTTLTADRAALAAKLVPGIRVWGGLVLNRSVGGVQSGCSRGRIGVRGGGDMDANIRCR